MTKVAEYLLGTLALCGLAWWGYSSWIDKPAKQERRQQITRAESSQRFNEWAYVGKEKEVRPGETVKLVIIPHSSGLEIMDTKCLIYTHSEFKQASMICPDARQDDIEAAE